MGAISVTSRVRSNIPDVEIANRMSFIHVVNMHSEYALCQSALSNKYPEITMSGGLRIFQIVIEIIIAEHNSGHVDYLNGLDSSEIILDEACEELEYTIHKEYLQGVDVTEDMIILCMEVISDSQFVNNLYNMYNHDKSTIVIGQWDGCNNSLMLHMIVVTNKERL